MLFQFIKQHKPSCIFYIIQCLQFEDRILSCDTKPQASSKIVVPKYRSYKLFTFIAKFKLKSNF